MKKILFLVLLGVQVSYAQKADKYITEANVSRVIKTLTADDLLGRSAKDEKSINKAAAFIEGEFKSIGLKPFTGLKSFRQEFALYENIEATSLVVKVNGEVVSNNNVILFADVETIKLNSATPVKQIEKDKSFRGALRPFMMDTITQVVFIAPEFENDFRQAHQYLSGARTIETANRKKGVTVFILGNPATDFSVDAVQKRTPLKMANVVGVLEGKSKKEEYVVFGGHYDHIGILPAVAGDSIANGADDDASGTTAVIELARYFKKLNSNERTLVFVAFTAEEIGGFGSRYFSKQINPDKVVAMFNIEMIGKPSKWGTNSAFITGFERSDFGEILQKNLAGSKFEFKSDPYPEQNLFYRSDNATLARLGVPAHTISTDQIDIDKLYHSVDDEFESMNIQNIVSTIKAIALSSKTIVNGTATPKRIDKSTVR